MTPPSAAADVDLARWIRPGDTVWIGQGCGEPLAWSTRLAAQRERLSGTRVVLCAMVAETFGPEHGDHLRFVLIAVSAGTRALAARGGVDVLPVHYSSIEGLARDGLVPVDVVMVQVSPPDARGRCSLGAGHDYLATLLPRARVVLAEVNRQAPRVAGDADFSLDDFDAVLETDRPLPAVSLPAPGALEARIAERVEPLVPERATLQLGIGAIPDALMTRLRGRRGLGYHSGILTDGVVDLIECGAIDDAHKGIDAGVAVTGLLHGTERTFRFADCNPRLAVRRPEYTHGQQTLARIQRLCSINGALEVDLTGQVGSEAIGGRYIGAIGGQVDFVRGARASPGGTSIIVLPSMQGGRSRIVARLGGPVTTPRSDADIVVTEWGTARLRGRTLRERIDAMVAIADPAHREALAREAYG
jgi:acyl-CoA hydrolase